jgi:hypothetical protein
MSKFVEGAEVYLVSPHGAIRFATIYKVHKNGNFVLEKGGKQYRPSHWGNYAWATGESYFRSSCSLLTDENRAEIMEKHAAYERCKAWRDLLEKLGKLKEVSVEQLAALQAVPQ